MFVEYAIKSRSHLILAVVGWENGLWNQILWTGMNGIPTEKVTFLIYTLVSPSEMGRNGDYG